jgi:hypothetical protein
MSTVYTGDPTAITTPLTRTITNATNASPIVVTTSAAHNFATNDRVTVEGVSGNTAANGDWVITKLSSTTFSLNGSTGNGAFGVIGSPTVTNHSLTPQFQIPSDDDTLNAASVNAAFETLGDRTQFLKEALDEAVDEIDEREAARSGETDAVVFTAAGPTTWTSGPHDRRIRLTGYGGGGGGGGGAGGGTGSSDYSCGGGGGGAAAQLEVDLEIEPNTEYEIIIGAGGAAGSAGAAGGSGGDGGDPGNTIFRLKAGAVKMAEFPGGYPGKGGTLTTSGATPYRFALGGSTTLTGLYGLPNALDSDSYQVSFALSPGTGGEGTAHQGSQFTRDGCGSASFNVGSSGGSYGADNTNHGGGAGGGGGIGPVSNFDTSFTDFPNGRDGGAGSAAGTGANAPSTKSTPPTANTGCGGAGGGGGGSGAVAGGTGSAGTAGASGKLTLRVIG